MRFALLLIAIALTGCAALHRTFPAGNYRETSPVCGSDADINASQADHNHHGCRPPT